jgi:hypothetical protein
LTNNKLAKTVNSMFRANFTRVQELVLSSNKIKKLDAGVFAQMKSSSRLTITNNSLNELFVDAFQGLGGLYELRVTLVSFECLKAGLFKHLPKLKILDLKEDGIFLLA